jgi:FixJ family two-component response regulator
VIVRAEPADALIVLSDRERHVDVLLTDVVMPGLSGVELAKQAQVLRPGLPVLYMTGYSREVVGYRGALPDGSAIVEKPFTRRDLLDAVGAVLGRGQRD